MKHDKIAVVDFGGQYAHLIATKVRSKRVLAEILQPEDPIEAFSGYKGIILSGSPALSAFDEQFDYTREIYDLDVPILGFCFGHQEIAKQYGGTVINGKKEWGHAYLHILKEHALFEGLSQVEQVWMSHNDSVSAVGPDFEEIGWSSLEEDPEGTPSDKQHHFAAIASEKYKRYGFQFHPEVDDSVHGGEMLENFAINICGCSPSWNMDNYLEEQYEQIRRAVGENSVFLLASGGVDSTVTAHLIAGALGPERLNMLHVDNGLMRMDESLKVIEAYQNAGLDRNLHFIDASEDFINALGHAVEPEEKRRIIGHTFIEVFEREARALGIEDHLLGQGTIYPDTIETGGTKRADTIKTHHNRVPIIEEMIAAGRVIEPISELYKVEVRALGKKLGISDKLISRHPFPGPGLGVRLLCSHGEESTDETEVVLTESVNETLKAQGLSTAVLPIKSVGVKADLRSYEHPLLLSGACEWRSLMRAADLVLKSTPGINRCVWSLWPNSLQNFRLLAATVTKERLDLLREADSLVMDGLRQHGIYHDIWQCPTVLVPMEVNGKGSEFCILRPVNSERAMTATAAELPEALIRELIDSISALPAISGLAFDITSKPPGTIEWE